MNNSDKDDIFTFANDEFRYVFTLFKTENERSQLAFEHGMHVNILRAISKCRTLLYFNNAFSKA